jgi:hypothetical protein
MAAKRKAKNTPKSKRAAVKKTTSKKTPAKAKKKTAAKKTPPKKALAKKAASRKPAAKKKPAVRKAVSSKTARRPRKRARQQEPIENPIAFPRTSRAADSAGQSGDLQGLSHRGGADSESVDELLEEGNAFEAEVVKGVEDAGDADEQEVHTHEVPEDDVPEEYLEED